jgi:hypothetical protein
MPSRRASTRSPLPPERWPFPPGYDRAAGGEEAVRPTPGALDGAPGPCHRVRPGRRWVYCSATWAGLRTKGADTGSMRRTRHRRGACDGGSSKAWNHSACAVDPYQPPQLLGYGGDGELGSGTMTNSDVPVAVTGIADAKAVVNGSQFGGLLPPAAIKSVHWLGPPRTNRPRLVSVLVSFNPVRHRSPVAALIVSAQVTDADGRR